MTVALRSLPQAFFKIKNEERKSFADWLIELANCGFGMSTDAFLKSVKKFLDKEVRIIPFLKQPLAFPTIPQSFVIFSESIARLLCKCKRSLSVACLSKFMYNYVVIVVSGYWASCPDTGQHGSSALSSAEAPAGYPHQNINNQKNRKRAGDDGKRETALSPLPIVPCALSFSFSPASLPKTQRASPQHKEASAEERGSSAKILISRWKQRQKS